jgi:long-chain acyl-CoA synthetase
MMEQSIPLMIRARAKKTPELIAQYSKDEFGVFQGKTYLQFHDETKNVAAGLLELGIKRKDHIGIISDNRQEWIVTDLGILSIGAIDVPRGCDSMVNEIAYILGFSECTLSFVENKKQVEKILAKIEEMPLLKTLVTFEKVPHEIFMQARNAGITLYHFSEIIEMGHKRRSANPGIIDAEIDKGQKEDLATIIFTSGTTGEPKGVMISHENILCQLDSIALVFPVQPGDTWLSVLPVWHIFERTIEYAAFFYNSGIAYSRPIASVLLADFQAVKPQWMAAVPRVWESIMDGVYRSIKQSGITTRKTFAFFIELASAHKYFKNLTFGLLPNFHGRIRVIDSLMGFFPWLLLIPLKGLGNLIVFNKVKNRIGGKFRAGISGGGKLPPKVDRFYNAIGLQLQEVYGLTESAPFLSARHYKKSRQGTVGQMLIDTEAKILDEQGNILHPGKQGLVYARGKQVMKGYYKKPELTAAILSSDGWLNTGDLGIMTYDNELKITGRAKDTIVLSGGENVEPIPMEQKMRESEWIVNAMVVGQDKKYLAAIVIPNKDLVTAYAEENNVPNMGYDLLLQQPEIIDVVYDEISALINANTGFKPFERVCKVKLLAKPFEIGIELSPKMELKRHAITEMYKSEIKTLFKD